MFESCPPYPVPATSGNDPGGVTSGVIFMPRLSRYFRHISWVSLVNCPVPSLLDSSLLPGVTAFPFFGGALVMFAKALIYSPFDLGADPKWAPQQPPRNVMVNSGYP